MPIDIDAPRVPTRPVRSAQPDDAAVGAFRPVMPKRGIPRLLRRLIGVDEDVLDWVPEERPRYTRLGLIVLNTGLLAGLSMHVALAGVTDVPWGLLLPADLLWALVIVTVDSWLISSTHGARRGSSIGMYIPRLLLSVLLGLAIAEPLVLWVFHQPIDNEISEFRKSEVEGYESALKRCNPPSGELVDDPSCDGLLVVITARPQAVQDELTRATAQRDELKTKVDWVDAELARLEGLARDECAGNPGGGLTGVPGEGPECTRNRLAADRFRADQAVDVKHRELAQAEQRVTDLNTALAQASGATEREVNAAITAKTEEKRDNLTARGLLDQFEALGRLSDRSAVVLAAHVLLTLLLIALDCMPVLSKLMSGSTKYDDEVRSQLDAASRLHDRQLRTNERRDSVDLEIQERRFDQKLRAGIEDIGGEDRSAKERRRIEMDAQIDRLAAALERER